MCSDARDFHLPAEKALCYFWDPFEAELMRTIVENIRNSLAAAPREIYIVYFMPVHRKLFDEAGFSDLGETGILVLHLHDIRTEFLLRRTRSMSDVRYSHTISKLPIANSYLKISTSY